MLSMLAYFELLTQPDGFTPTPLLRSPNHLDSNSCVHGLQRLPTAAGVLSEEYPPVPSSGSTQINAAMPPGENSLFSAGQPKTNRSRNRAGLRKKAKPGSVIQGQGGASPVRHSGLGWSQVALTSLIRGSVIYITEGHGRHVRGRGARIRDSDMPLT